MTTKSLALVFVACIVAGFFLAGFGDNAGATAVTVIGGIIVAVGLAAWVMWWKNPNRK